MGGLGCKRNYRGFPRPQDSGHRIQATQNKKKPPTNLAFVGGNRIANARWAYLRCRIFARIRRFFRPTFRRPLPRRAPILVTFFRDGSGTEFRLNTFQR